MKNNEKYTKNLITGINSLHERKGIKYGFTLVELIVVITILAILGTIAFISLQGYSSQSRDAVRISDIYIMNAGLKLFNMESGKYPLPSGGTAITYSGAIVWTQGYFGEEVTKNVDKLNKVPTDPITNKMYVYSTTDSRNEYQIACAMEGDEISLVNSVLSAEKTARLKISGTYNGKVLKVSTGSTSYVLAIPSIIANSGTTLENIVANKLLAYNGYKNLPFQYAKSYKIDGETGLTLVNSGSLIVFSGSISVLSDSTNSGQLARSNLLTNLKTAYINTNISGIGEIAQILNTTSSEESSNLAKTIVSNNLGGKIVVGTTSNEIRNVYGDEDVQAIGACNKWVTDNVPLLAGDYIWVPARNFITDGTGTALTDSFYQREVSYNGVNYICNGFAVAKYEMSYDDLLAKHSTATSWETIAYSGAQTPISKADRLAVVDIKQVEAISQCKKLGTGSHLITNNEWMGIARNIEAQSGNWSGALVGTGHIPNGYNENIPPYTSGYDGNADGTWAEPTGTDCEGDKNQLILSNGQKIWDLAGNVMEHVNKANNTLDSSNNPTFSKSDACSGISGWYNWYGDNECIYTNSYSREKYGPIGEYDASQGMGKIYSLATSVNNIFIRGGYASDGNNAGLYSLRTNFLYTQIAYNLGFRCAW